jgi:hypothetical protein
MLAIASLFVRWLCDCVKPRQRLEAETLALRHQLNILVALVFESSMLSKFADEELNALFESPWRTFLVLRVVSTLTST